MKFFDYVLLSLAVVFFIIGIDQIIRLGQEIIDTYWIFMMTAMCLIWLSLRRNQQKEQESTNQKMPHSNKNTRSTQSSRK